MIVIGLDGFCIKIANFAIKLKISLQWERECCFYWVWRF